MERLVIGCMTGTSLDALDVCAVGISGRGLAMTARVLVHTSRPLAGLAAPLRELAEQQPMSAGRIAEVATEFARLHAGAVRELLASATELSGRRPDLIAVHGQTVYHAPPHSWQLFNPAPLATALRCPVICDLRSADIALGGQGAPITPLADWVLLRGPRPRVVLNLGGFANYTYLPGDDGRPAEQQIAGIRGGDICACNHLLDGIARICFGKPYDDRGQQAAAGQPHARLVEELGRMLAGQMLPGRSLGTGDELESWLRERATDVSGPDLARSACVALAGALAAAIAPLGALEGVLAAGGTVRHELLMSELGGRLAAPLRSTDDAGLSAAAREAAEMAVLGALSVDGVAITLPQVTGVPAPAPVAGVICRPA